MRTPLNHSLRHVFPVAAAFVLVASIIVSCGGDSDGGGDSIIRGVVTESAARSALRHDSPLDGAPINNVVVCGLGGCDTTNTSGEFQFDLDLSTFTGGPALFTLTRDGQDFPIIIPDLIPNPADVELRLAFDDAGNVFIVDIHQTAFTTVAPTPDTSGTAAPGENPTATPTVAVTEVPETPGGGTEPTATAAPSNPEFTINRTTITFDHSVGVTSCPQEIGEIEIENTGDVAMDFTTSVSGPLSTSPSSFSLNPGETQVIKVFFTCAQASDFSGLVNINSSAAGTQTVAVVGNIQ